MNKTFSGAWILFPFLMAAKDVVSTMIMLSNEPGITSTNVWHYRSMLVPGSLLPVPAPLASLCNIALAALAGYVVSRKIKNSRHVVTF